MDTTLDQTERRRSRRLLGTGCTTHAAHDGLSDMLYVLLPVLAEQFGLSLIQVGLVRGAHRARRHGVHSDRFFVGVCGAATDVVPRRLGQSVQHPLCSSNLNAAYRDGGRRGALGTYNFAGDLGKFTIAGSSSLLLAAGVAWQTPVIGFGMIMVLGVVLLMLALIRMNAGGLPAVPETAEIQKAKG